ncbi:MAG: hypothetical protein MUE51_15025 [Thermoleophilia bacterium]|nr:hypothetical protein [Thermoleophilia bacterium]
MTARLRAALDRSAVLAVLLALVLPVWLLASSAAEHGFDPTTWIVGGEQYRAVDRLPADAVRVPQTGYDGQFYYALAQDPLALKEETRTALDSPAYRAQRLLLPGVAYVLSLGGRQPLLNWLIPFINLMAIGLTAYAVARLATGAGNPAWIGIGAGVVTGVIAATLRDLTEPLALAALALGILARSRDRPVLWGVAAAAACLGRESLAVAVVALVLVDLIRRRWRLAISGALALIPALTWQLILLAHLGQAGPSGAGEGTWGSPLKAPLDYIRALRTSGELWAPYGIWTIAFIALTGLLVAWALSESVRMANPLGVPLAAFSALALVYGFSLWADAWAFTRNLSVVWLLLVAVAATLSTGRLRFAAPVASIGLTIGFAIVGGVPRTPW